MTAMSHEEVELKSPFPIIPPVKHSKWNELPSSPDGQSQPLEPPKLLPDIGEPHPCPFYAGPDLNFIRPRQKKKPPAAPPVVPTPVIPPPVIPASKIPPVIPAPVIPPPVLPISPPVEPEPAEEKPPTPEKDDSSTTKEEDEAIEACLQECLHGVVWDCVATFGQDMTKEMFCALISSNPQKFILDRATLSVLWRKISKKPNANNWTEPCEMPIDRLKLDVLSAQAYKLLKARNTVTNEAVADFHRKAVSQATSNHLLDLYSSNMEKKVKAQDAKDFKQQPPRVAA